MMQAAEKIAVFQTLAAERAQRLIADIAAWQGECEYGSNNIEIARLYHAMNRAGQQLRLDGGDLVLAFILLDRFYSALEHVSAFTSEATREYLVRADALQRFIHAVYLAQSILYDEPLSKRYWMHLTSTRFDRFVEDTLVFCDVIHFDLSMDAEDVFSAYTDLIGPIEQHALQLYRRVSAAMRAMDKEKHVASKQAAHPVQRDPVLPPTGQLLLEQVVPGSGRCAVQRPYRQQHRPHHAYHPFHHQHRSQGSTLA